MDRLICFCVEQPDFSNVCDALKGGWELDPELKAFKLDAAVVYHLVKYGDGEKPWVEPEKDVEIVVEVKTDSDPLIVKAWTDQDHKVLGYYLGKVQLVKYREAPSRRATLRSMRSWTH